MIQVSAHGAVYGVKPLIEEHPLNAPTLRCCYYARPPLCIMKSVEGRMM